MSATLMIILMIHIWIFQYHKYIFILIFVSKYLLFKSSEKYKKVE